MKLFMHELGYPVCNKNAGSAEVDVQFLSVAEGVTQITRRIPMV